MHLREYRPDDLTEVVRLFQCTVRGVNGRDYSPEQVAAWAPEPADFSFWEQRLSTGMVLVCDGAGAIVGFIRVDKAEHGDEEAVVDLLYVDSAHQRRGVARGLLHEALDRLGRQGVSKVLAEVSITARLFFERMGFEVLKRQKVTRRGVAFDNFLMTRTSGNTDCP